MGFLRLMAIGLLGASALGGPPLPQFVERGAATGVAKPHWDGSLPAGIGTLQILSPMVAGVAAADYDGDGWCDLYVTRLFMPNLLYRNRGNGAFEDRAADLGVDFSGFSTGCLWTDINNDGRLDLYLVVAGTDERNRLFVQQANGSFSEEAETRGAALPLEFTFTRNFMSACSGDFDLDGSLDLVVSEWSGNLSRNVLLQNDGSGHYQDVSVARGVPLGASYGFSPALIDCDDDGWPELSIAGDYGTSQLYHNLGGTFQRRTRLADVGSDENGMGSAWGDVDGDGLPDWFVSSIYDPNDTCGGGLCGWQPSGNRLYRNEPNELRFRDLTDHAGVRPGGWGWGSSFFDCDHDGDLDLVQTNGIVFGDTPLEDMFNADPTMLWLNDGSGQMTEASNSLGLVDHGNGKGIALLDYDRDGDLDLFVANNAAAPHLWENQLSSANWLRVQLRGHRSNRLGIGAQLRLEASPGAAMQVRHAQLNSNYLSHNEPLPHFGLGNHALVHRLEIYWPASGIRQVLHDLPVNQIVLVEEPCGGDTNGDRLVDLSDLAVLLQNFGLAPAVRAEGDLDWDQQVGLADLALVLRTFGEVCAD